MELLLNADIGFLPPDCSDVQLSGQIFLRARNEARGREALPWLICTRATASDDYRGVSLQRGRHRSAGFYYQAARVAMQIDCSWLRDTSKRQNVRIHEIPSEMLEELSRGLAALKEQNLPDGHFSDRVWAADTQVSILLRQHAAPGSFIHSLHFCPASDFAATSVVNPDIFEWSFLEYLTLPCSLPPVQLYPAGARSVSIPGCGSWADSSEMKPKVLCASRGSSCVWRWRQSLPTWFWQQVTELEAASHWKHSVAYLVPPSRLQEVMARLTPGEHPDHVFAKFWRAGIVSASCDNAKFRITPHLPNDDSEPRQRRILGSASIVGPSWYGKFSGTLWIKHAAQSPCSTQFGKACYGALQAAAHRALRNRQRADVAECLQKLAEAPPRCVWELQAPPGCGKTELMLCLLQQLLSAETEHIHLLLAPSRKLRDDMLRRCLTKFRSDILLPLGQSTGGEDHHFAHSIRRLEERRPDLKAAVDRLEQDLRQTATGSWQDWEARARKLELHHGLIFELYYNQEPPTEATRIIITTRSFMTKACAKEASSVVQHLLRATWCRVLGRD
eukprot:s4513_g8.t1